MKNYIYRLVTASRDLWHLVNLRARAVVSRGFTKYMYHRSHWTQSLACLGYGQYTDMFTCISTYMYIFVQIPCFLVQMYMYTEATRSAVKKTCRFAIEKRGRLLKIVALEDQSHYRI